MSMGHTVQRASANFRWTVRPRRLSMPWPTRSEFISIPFLCYRKTSWMRWRNKGWPHRRKRAPLVWQAGSDDRFSRWPRQSPDLIHDQWRDEDRACSPDGATARRAARAAPTDWREKRLRRRRVGLMLG